MGILIEVALLNFLHNVFQIALEVLGIQVRK